MSNFLESGLLNHFFRTSAYTRPTQIAIGLTTNPPSDSDPGTTSKEVGDGIGYTRQLIAQDNANWTNPTLAGLIENVNAVSFGPASADWGMVSGVVILDNNGHGSGNILFHGTLSVARDVRSGDTFNFAAGEIDITFA